MALATTIVGAPAPSATKKKEKPPKLDYEVLTDGTINGRWYEEGAVISLFEKQAKHYTAPYGNQLKPFAAASSSVRNKKPATPESA